MPGTFMGRNHSENKTSFLSAEETLSQTVSFLRLVLIIAVVFVHSRWREPGDYNGNWYDLFVYIFTGVFERLPALVLFSGFLFFKSGFSTVIYRKKLKSRFKSLLVPYLFWNVAVLLFYLVLQIGMLQAGRTPGSTLVWQYTAHDWWYAFWGGPIARQFWFIRNLMMLIAFSPIFYLLVRYLHFWGVLLAAIPWLFLTDTVWYMHTYTFFFFAAGA